MKASAKTTQIMHKDFNEVFVEILCFKGLFFCRLKMVQAISGTTQACSTCTTRTV